MNAIGYARYSSHRQDEDSIQQQEAAYRAWCQANGAAYLRTFSDEAKSGRTDAGRDGLLEMMAYVNAKPQLANTVLLWKRDRLSRDIADAPYLTAQIRRAGLDLVYIADEWLNVDGPMRAVLEALADFKNHQYRTDLSANVRRGMIATLERGGVGNQAPLGYRIERGPDDVPRLVPDPATWDRVREAWRLRLMGYNLTDIDRRLHLYGSLNGYHHMFKRAIYAGRLEWGGQAWPAQIEPMVTPEEFEQVQALRLKWRHPRERGAKKLLSGLVRCGVCGGTVKADSSSRKEYRTPTVYHYYACRPPGQTHVSARLEPLETAVVERIAAVYTPNQMREHYDEAVRQLADVQANAVRDAKLRRDRLAAVNASIERLAAAIEQGGPLDTLVKRLADLEQERAQLRQSRPAVPPHNLPDLETLCAEMQALIAEPDYYSRRLAVEGAVRHIVLHPGGAFDIVWDFVRL